MQLRLTKQFDFQMAHALCGYDGKCRNIHGHNYKLMVTVEGTPIDNPDEAKNGMVIDFSDIKCIVEKYVVEPLDHALVLPEGSPYLSLLNGVDNQEDKPKMIVTPFQPTCENMLLYFARLLDGRFPDGVKLYSMRLYETDTSFAELLL
ncbi:MAG: 6-carboxytetrahydropterin synthase [Bacteroidales bacterium]|nr:6-carboxytetrahydropterin synthase [Bacteroidales bacterium]